MAYPDKAPNQNNQSKESFNKSSTCFRKMKKSHLMKKVMKIFQMEMTVSESILKMIKNRNCCNSPKIFTRSEPKIFARCRCLNNQWHRKLEGDEIAKRNFFMTKGRHIGILLSFGFPSLEIGRDWALNIPQGHEVNVPVTLPFTISDFGWWHVESSDNGIVCVRYIMSGQPTQLTVWNPLTSKSRELTDRVEAGGLQAVSPYTFGYMDNSDHYIIIHISKKRFRHSILSYCVYNSGVEGWQQGEFDHGMIQKIGPNGVWHKDSAYWINWVGEDFTHPVSVIIFDAQSLKFIKLKIPKYVKKRFQYLSEYKGKLCLLRKRG
ncbi:hypothetical protein PIB30_026324 [Stylosanthes scabra]|uniref:F-box associated beta-propeller type 1 domain-containing protein n=1 Tax=Stylosanthes scabra TaxID=79078 RepID=A0ABU6X8H5_9FABA|nr:hypothetical protein [Stylosanthes scabra]